MCVYIYISLSSGLCTNKITSYMCARKRIIIYIRITLLLTELESLSSLSHLNCVFLCYYLCVNFLSLFIDALLTEVSVKYAFRSLIPFASTFLTINRFDEHRS